MAANENGGNFDYLKEMVKKHGLGPNLYNELKAEREKWKKEVINIAFVGQARQGKSSHINAHVGKRVAKVKASGVCTTDIRCFTHPQNENIKLWDVPGIDAVQFPRERYFEKIGYYENNYDFFLVVTKDIFSSDAKFIADWVQKENKRFYLVRTHIDVSIRNELEDNPGIEGKDVIADIRKNISKELETFAFDTSRYKVYLVSNRHPILYDFPDLQKDICRDSTSEFQQEALLLTIKSHGLEMINMKYNLFRTRIWKAAAISGAGGAVPLPGFSFALDLGILVEEALTYFVGFGLSKEAIASFEELNQVEVGTIESALNAKLRSSYPVLYYIRERSTAAPLTRETITTTTARIVSEGGKYLMTQFALSNGSEWVESTIKFALPIVGSVAAAAISFSVTKYQLGTFLEQTKDIALFVNSYLTDVESRRMEFFEYPN